ncbi:hypothetical protein D9M70_470940 [compost metagenome]
MLIDVALHALQALIVDVDMPEDMRGRRSARIKAPLFRPEADAGNAECQYVRLLSRRELSPQPLEGGAGSKLPVRIAPIEIGNDGRELLDDFVRIDDLSRLGIERHHVDVGRQQFPMPIDDVRAGGHSVAGVVDPRRLDRSFQSVLDQSPHDHQKDQGKAGDDDAKPLPCLRSPAQGDADDRSAFATDVSFQGKMCPAFQPDGERDQCHSERIQI